MNLVQHRARICVGISLVLLFVIVVSGSIVLMNKMAWANETLAEIEPRFARLLGIQVSSAEISRAAAEANAALSRYTYPPASGADRIGTDLQQRLRTAAETAGVSVTGSQIVSGRTDNGLEDVLVSMTFETDLKQLEDMLEAVVSQSPAVYVDGLMLQPARRVGGKGRLVVQVRFSVLRRLS